MTKSIKSGFYQLFAGSIRRRLTLAFAFSTAVLMLGFGVALVVQERGFMMEQSLQHTQTLAHTVAVSSASWVVANDVVGLQEVLKSVARSPNLKYAFVQSPAGRVLASNRIENIGRYVNDPVSQKLRTAQPKPVVLVDNVDLVDVAEPVLAGERLVGWVRIGWGRDDVANNLRAVTRRSYLMVVLAVSVALIVATMLARSLSVGLRRLITVANQIRSGGRAVRADVDRRDELGVLADNFNVMLDELVESERKLEKLNRVYAAWIKCSNAIVHETSEKQLLGRICQILAECVPFKLVWVGMPDADGRVTLVAANDPASEYPDQDIHISLDTERPEDQAPMSMAIRSGIPQIHSNLPGDESVPWRVAAERQGFVSVGAFPLMRSGRCVGAFGVYSSERDFFNHDIEALLNGLADDVSHALNGFDRERLRSEAEAKVLLAAKVFENSKEGILVVDANVNIVSVNSGFTEITGYGQDEVFGKNPALLSSGRQDKAFYDAMWAQIKRNSSWQGEVWNRRKDGELYPQWLTITCMKNEAGEVTNYIGIFSDISERKLSEERIQHLAHYDALTDLPNRVLFQDRLDQTLIKAQRADETVALIFLDLDRFKQINDTLGHSMGDDLLRTVALRLLECVREQDTVSRQGGDEFLIMLPGTTADGAALVAQKMLLALADPCLVDGHALRITPSMGISLYPDDATDIETLIKLADVAMYHAKDIGRNNYQFYTASLNASAYEHLALENGMRLALERDEFLLHYQPQLDLATGGIIGCEALIRWNHPEHGMLSPAKFIAVAEECGLIVLISEWVMREACRQLRIWQDAGHGSLTMAVNMSALQFRKAGLEDTVVRALHDAGVLARSVELELTESVIMHGVDATLATLKKLAALGLQLSIDDFGTGYSSLSYLKRFPIHKLKIDQSFVRDLVTDVNDAAIVRTIIVMAHSLNLRVVAEGVETAEQLAFLREAGCNEMQGYYFSRPVPADELLALLQSGIRLCTSEKSCPAPHL
jgi:diguanylate cyclase (GGDEF)-like protein/PAS domain S-box-containing protein